MDTERLYYRDSYLKEFRARVTERDAEGRRLYLDRTAFYPASGGQPHDTGFLAGIPVVDVVDEGNRIAHITAGPVSGVDVEGSLDWERRFDHMQQHSGQHLLSGVLVRQFGFPTVSFHLGEEISTIELERASLDTKMVAEIERQANRIVTENRTVAISFQEASAADGLRRASEREGLLRIVEIEGLDRSACGGTHVRATGEVGPILLRRLERIRGNVRIEFVCGMRAVRRARADFDAISAAARALSATLDETPALVSSQIEALRSAEKDRRKLAGELARFRGRELYGATSPDSGGFRRAVQTLPSGSIGDELRGFAQGFTSGPRAVLLVAIRNTPAVLFAVSQDSGLHAGDTLRRVLARHGGRGGGAGMVAQGSVPTVEALDALCRELSEI